jgi:hypothetical protein
MVIVESLINDESNDSRNVLNDSKSRMEKHDSITESKVSEPSRSKNDSTNDDDHDFCIVVQTTMSPTKKSHDDDDDHDMNEAIRRSFEDQYSIIREKQHGLEELMETTVNTDSYVISHADNSNIIKETLDVDEKHDEDIDTVNGNYTS